MRRTGLRRAFTLQMHDRPDGRAFTCTGCGAACMRPADAQQPVCADCSPFIAVSINGRRRIEAVCRWCRVPVMLSSVADAERWAEDDHIPTHVLDSLRAHFVKCAIPVHVVPPPEPMPAATQGGIIQVKAGDLVSAANGVPIGIATASVEAGGMLPVQLNSAQLPAGDDDEDRVTGL